MRASNTSHLCFLSDCASLEVYLEAAVLFHATSHERALSIVAFY